MSLKEGLVRWRPPRLDSMADVQHALDELGMSWELVLYYLEQQEDLEQSDTGSIQGADVSATAPMNGQYLGYDRVALEWEPKTLAEGEGVDIATAGDGDLTIAAEDAASGNKGIVALDNDLGGTAAAPVVTAVQGQFINPTTPNLGNVMVWDTNATPDRWVARSIAGGEGINVGIAANGQNTISAEDATAGNKGILQLAGYLGGTAASPTVRDATGALKGAVQLAGDLGGTAASPEVTGLRGDTVENATPSDGDILRWNNSASEWQHDGEEIFWGANDLDLRPGASRQTSWSTASFNAVLFPETSDEQALAQFVVPRAWINKNLTLEYVIGGAGTAGDCRTVWGVEDGRLNNTNVTGVTSTFALGGSEVLVSASTTVNLSGSGVGDKATMAIGRDPDHADDDIADSIRLYSVRLYVTQ